MNISLVVLEIAVSVGATKKEISKFGR